jgi:hypothetical protein
MFWDIILPDGTVLTRAIHGTKWAEGVIDCKLVPSEEPANPRSGRLRKIHTYEPMTPANRPQDPTLDGAGWSYENLEHGGEFADDFPNAIKATDSEGRSCTYVPIQVGGRSVVSHGFNTVQE